MNTYGNKKSSLCHENHGMINHPK